MHNWNHFRMEKIGLTTASYWYLVKRSLFFIALCNKSHWKERTELNTALQYADPEQCSKGLFINDVIT